MTPYLVVLLLSAPVQDVQSAPPPPPVCASTASVRPGTRLTNVEWVHRPSAPDEMEYYPRLVFAQGIEGRATLKCSVTVNGTLTGCSIVREWPAHKGFGPATLRLAPYFKMRPCTAAGLHVTGATVVIPVRWWMK